MGSPARRGLGGDLGRTNRLTAMTARSRPSKIMAAALSYADGFMSRSPKDPQVLGYMNAYGALENTEAYHGLIVVAGSLAAHERHMGALDGPSVGNEDHRMREGDSQELEAFVSRYCAKPRGLDAVPRRGIGRHSRRLEVPRSPTRS